MSRCVDLDLDNVVRRFMVVTTMEAVERIVRVMAVMVTVRESEKWWIMVDLFLQLLFC